MCGQRNDGRPSVNSLRRLCRAKGKLGYAEIALGQGQVGDAVAAVHEAAARGSWLCLKNTHLAVAWLPELARLLHDVGPSAHAGFRMWLTTEPHPTFPVQLLSACLVRPHPLAAAMSGCRSQDLAHGMQCHAALFRPPIQVCWNVCHIVGCAGAAVYACGADRVYMWCCADGGAGARAGGQE
jgi:Dynein heavy chain region D6 P-loop domain